MQMAKSAVKPRKISRIRYHVNATAGVVKATINNVDKDAVDFIHNVLHAKIPTDLYDKILMAPSYKAKIRCHFEEGDKFDEQFGKDHAKARLQAKLKAAKMKRVAIFLSDAQRRVDVMEEKMYHKNVNAVVEENSENVLKTT